MSIKPISGFDPPVDPDAAIREFDGTVIRIPNPSRLAIILEPGSVETGSRTVVQDCNFGLVLTIAPEGVAPQTHVDVSAADALPGGRSKADA